MSVSAQQITISGKVLDATSQSPLLGATILQKGTSNATSTDFNGDFTIDIPAGGTLVITYVGYIAQERSYAASSTVTINLTQDVAALDQIVVVGYGTQSIKEITGAVSVVNSETIENLKPTRIEQALQGQVPGVTITSTSGAPGAASNIRIRGIGTNGDARPLILVDGNVIEDLSVINPGDIESVSVLKDATAGIYGVRAANGVVIITTKSGRRNQDLVVTYDAYGGFQQSSRELPTLNAQQYALLLNEAFANNGEPLPFPNASNLNTTDYQDEVFKNAPIFNHNIGIRGGTEKAAYGFGASYLTQDGVVGGSKASFERVTGRLNFDYKWLDNLEMRTGFLYSYTDRNTIAENGLGSVLFNALNMDPTLPVRDQFGSFTLAEGLGNEVINPVHQLFNTFNENKVSKIGGNFGLTYEFLNDFEATARIQYNYAEAYGNSFQPEAFYGSGKVFNIDRNVFNRYSNYFRDYTYDAFVKYEHAFAEAHNVEATLGLSAFRTTGKFNGFTGFDIPGNDYDNASIDNASDVVDNFMNGGDTFDSRLLSQFLRVQYDYEGRYLFSGVIRRDGSTKFGPENKFGYFPSVSAGWVMSDEDFMESVDAVDFLKLRASYGIIGNDRIGDFGFISLLTGEGAYVFNDELFFGTAIGQLSNPKIKWEEQYTANFGIDAGFISNKLNVNLDLFTRTTRDLLLVPTVSGILGVGAPGSAPPIINGGDVRNRGIEFAVSYRDAVGEDFNYNVSYNFSAVDNEVLFVDNDNGFLEGGSFGVGQPAPARFEEGFPIGYFYGYQTDGIFQTQAEVDAHPSQLALGANAQPGDIRFVDINQDGVIDTDDRTDIGDPIPDVTMGLNLNFNYKNFDFQTYLYASIGNDIVRNYERNQNRTNRTTNALDRWTGPGTSNSVPRVTTGATSNLVFSDFYVEDGSFLRANNMQLGYTFQQESIEKVKLSKMRLYVSANNLFTLTKYRGYDPSASNGAPIGSGFDSGFYPVPRTFIIGFNAQF
jgi:TonB-linked SusC/RagA family outer membrane protein